jgi:hypothetical protein
MSYFQIKQTGEFDLLMKNKNKIKKVIYQSIQQII